MPYLKEFERQGRARLADRERIQTKRVLVFVLEAALGAIVCAGTILAIFAWTGAGL
jgi:hypothetical protein